MKFTTTKYLGTKQIFKFPDHYVAMPVMVSDENVEANEEGKKIVPMGTIVGGGVLADPSIEVSDCHYGASAATATSTVADVNGKIKFTAKQTGTAGNSIVVKMTKGANGSTTAVTVSNTTINVSLGADAEGTINATANEVIAEINAGAGKALVEALPVGDGTANCKAETINLANGTDSEVGSAEGVLVDDVDVTYGSAVAAMCIHGFIDVTKMPYAPTADDMDALGMIKFFN